MKKSTVSAGLNAISALGAMVLFAASANAFAEGSSEQKSVLDNVSDWRQSMQDKGYKLDFGYVSQTAYLAKGGYTDDRATKYIDQFHFKFNFDLNKIAGIQDAEIDALIVNRNHDDNLTYSDLYDPQAPFVNSTQESHGRGSIWRLGLLSYRQAFFDQKLKIRAGLINKVWDFDNATPCDFQTLMLCGGKSANNGIWYNWNVGQWGVSAQYKFAPEWTVKTGLYDQNPRREDRNQAFSLFTSGSKGTVIPLELEYRPVFGNGKLPGIYQLGATYSNADYNDLYLASNNQPQALFPHLAPKVHSDQEFLYWNFTQQITQQGAASTDGMHLFFTGGIGDRSKIVKYNYSAGIRYPGIFSQRPKDSFGIGVSYAKLNNDYINNARLTNQLGAGVAGFNPVLIRDSAEVVGEVYYNFQVTPAISIQPGLQYWINPAGVSQTEDAYVVGLKLMANF